MENNKEGIQPIQPAVPTDNATPAEPTTIPVNNFAEPNPAEPIAPVAPAEPVAPSAAATEQFTSAETAVSDELLQEMHKLDSGPQPAAQNSDIVLTNAPKKSHLTVILLTILLVGIVAAAGVFAYFYFTKPTTSGNSGQSNTNSKTDDKTPTPTPTPTPKPDDTDNSSVEGTAITDSSVTEELTQKISTILGIKPDEDLTFKSYASIVTRDIELIENGDISDGKRLHAVVFSMGDLFEPLTDEQVDTIETEDNISLIFTEKTAVDATLVAEVYESLFGEAPTHQDTDGVCAFSYNETLDVYYNGNAGCGGTFPNYRFYQITDFTESENSAYVYVKVASIYEDSDILCDISMNPVESGFKTCGAAPTDIETVDFSNQSADFAKYRFVFNKAENGSYYFVKLEKV